MAKKKGTTVDVDGITVTVDIDLADDFELTEQSAMANDPYATPAERLSSTIRVYKLLLGNDYRRVKDELREKNGGHLPLAAMVDFISNVVSKVAEAKNSGSSDES